MTTPPAGALDRRGFLKLGLAGTVALGGLSAVGGCARQDPVPAPGYGFLTAEDDALMRALLPAVNGAAWPGTEPVRAAALQRIDAALLALDGPAQHQTRQLFGLLHWAPFRRWACGVSTPWERASPAELQQFLDRWRSSRLGLFNAGYRGLSKLAQLGWWSQPASWTASGYPGPPPWARTALET